MGRVLVTRRLPHGAVAGLRAAGHELVPGFAPPGDADADVAMDADELVGLAGDVDGIVCLLTDRIDAAVLSAGAAGRLRVVANVAVGYDNIDVAAAERLGIVVCNTPGVLDETTADLAFLLVLAASRLASEAEGDLRQGRWTGWSLLGYLGHDVHGAVLGLVGYGRIARAVERRAAGFGMTVVHHARTPSGLPGYRADLADLLDESDVVSLHVPLTPVTHHLIGAPELARMGPGAVLVNTARGPVVDEEALADALCAGTIFAAGLDVYDGEPAVNPRLLAAPRTVLLPHIGSASVATRTRMAVMACDAVATVLAGGVPPNVVVPGPAPAVPPA